MNDPAFLEMLRAAEAGETRFPVATRTGIVAEAARLDLAAERLFAEGEEAGKTFALLVETGPGSPFFFRAERLKLMYRHRVGLKKALDSDSPLSRLLFDGLAAGPGPTSAKARIAAMIGTAESDARLRRLLRAVKTSAPAIHKAESVWLSRLAGETAYAALSPRKKSYAPHALAIGTSLIAIMVTAAVTTDNPGRPRIDRPHDISPLAGQGIRMTNEEIRRRDAEAFSDDLSYSFHDTPENRRLVRFAEKSARSTTYDGRIRILVAVMRFKRSLSGDESLLEKETANLLVVLKAEGHPYVPALTAEDPS